MRRPGTSIGSTQQRRLAALGAIARHLLHRPALWQDAAFVLCLADDVNIGAAGVDELFRVMRQHGLRAAQPSLAWRSHFVDAATLNNPSFLLRYTNRVDFAAIAFETAALRRWLHLLSALFDAATLARVLPLCCEETSGARRRRRPNAPAPAERQFPAPAWTGALRLTGSPD